MEKIPSDEEAEAALAAALSEESLQEFTVPTNPLPEITSSKSQESFPDSSARNNYQPEAVLLS